MTSLEQFSDSSFDLVWSGQSIEHVEPCAAARMCREALRALRPNVIAHDPEDGYILYFQSRKRA